MAGPFESTHEPYEKSLAIGRRARHGGRDGVDEKEDAPKCYDQNLAAIMQGRRSDAGPQ